LILSFVLSSWAVVGALWPYCPAQCESSLFVIAVNAWFGAKENDDDEGLAKKVKSTS